MKSKVKDHLSDGEEDNDIDSTTSSQNQVAVRQTKKLSREEEERKKLENVPVIADSEISPAAYLFQN